MVKSKIYVIQHGQNDKNTTTEKRNAVELGKQFINVAFDYVLTSPLNCATEICDIILKVNKYGGIRLADQRITEQANQEQVFALLDELKLKVKDTDGRILIVAHKNTSPIIQLYFQSKHESSDKNISVYEFDYSK